MMEPANIDNLCILYQSSNFIVVNKHWDIRIDSKMWYEKQTVQSQLKQRFPELADPDTYYGFRFCHQLDFSTSGALCVALNKSAAGKAYRCFKERLVTKAYLALVRGHVQSSRMTVDYAIGKNTTEGMTHMMCIEGTHGCENPKPCQTELIVLEYGTYDGDPVTKILLKVVNCPASVPSRTHQLRVHCSSIGHPIVGDFTYSLKKKDCAPYRMMLHAYFLRIPVEAEPTEVTACDPFLTSIDPKWVPERREQQLERLIQELKDQDVADQDLAEEHRRQKELLMKQDQGRAEQSVMESKEQRVQCEQWLAEWTLD